MKYYELTAQEQREVLDEVIDKENLYDEIKGVYEDAEKDGFDGDDAVEDYILDEYGEDVDMILNAGNSEDEALYWQEYAGQDEYYGI